MPASLTQKLQLKPGQQLALLNAPPGMAHYLAAELDGISVSAEAAGSVHALLLFVTTLGDVESLAPGAIAAVGPAGLLWIAYPKAAQLGTELNRDRLWAAMEPTGWRPVRQVALDDLWSAMRFRPADQVK